MKSALFAALILATTISQPGHAAPAAQPLVIELFTSQGCSSCPPADALLGELKRTRPDLLPLDFHVDYWNGLGWADPFSSAAATERQRHYSQLFGDGQVHTPELVIGGRHQAVGSDRGAVTSAIALAEGEAAATPVSVTARHDGGRLQVDIGAGQGAADILLIGYDDQHATPVGRGENSGRMLTEVNVVRSISHAGHWEGKPIGLAVAPPAGERIAVILQASDGTILAANTPPVS